MREILFKGKAKDTGEWLYGYIFEVYKKTGIFRGMINETFIEVDPETVCQYTGLTDKNEKKIFEGDICEYKNTLGEYGIGIIEYDCVSWISGNIAKTDFMTPLFYLKCSTEWEVIGNIFDNPELLTED